MKRATVYFVSLVLAAGFSVSCRDGNELRLVTYNVGAFHKAGFSTEQMCEQILMELEPDAVSLNELDSCNTRGGICNDQLAQVSAALGGWPCVFGSAIAYKGGSYGIGVLTAPKHGVIEKWTAKLPKVDGREVRALAVIENEKFVLCSTHLDLTDSSQLAQVAAIDSLIAERYEGFDKPVFLCGDMNAEPPSATIQRLAENWQILSSTDFTFSTDNPCKCIDFIFAYRKAAPVEVLEARVCTAFENKELDATVASDHFPSFVKIKVL